MLKTGFKKLYNRKKRNPNWKKEFRTLQAHQISLEEKFQFAQQIIQEKEEDVYRLEVLGQIKQSVLVDQTTRQFAQNAFDLLYNLIPHDHASVILFDFENNKGEVLVTHGSGEIDLYSGDQLPLEDCYANLDMLVGDYIQLEPATLSPQPFCLLESKLRQAGIQSYISLLLISHNEVIGSLNIASFQPAAFNQAAIRIARDVADSLAVAIQKATLFEQTRLKAAELESLANLSSELRRAETWNEIIQIMIREAMQVMNASTGGFLWIDSGDLHCICGAGDDCDCLEDCPQKPEPALQDLLDYSQPIFEAHHGAELCDILPLKVQSQSAALMPLKTVGVIVGKLFIAFESKREFSEEDKRLLTSMVDIAGNALYRANILETLEQRVANRTQELATLYSIANIISRATDLQSILDQSLSSILNAYKASAGVIQVWDEDTKKLEIQATRGLFQGTNSSNPSFLNYVAEQDSPLLVSDLTAHPSFLRDTNLSREFRSFICAPIRGHAQTIGLLSFFSDQPQAFDREDLSLLTSVADHLSIAVENNRLRRRAEDAIVIEERQRLARELHDSISQLLYSQLLFAEAGLKALTNDDLEILPSYLHRLAEVADQAFREMRLMIYSLRPKVLESVGLVGALQYRLNTVEKRAGMETKLTADEIANIPSQIEDGLFRIAQEALNNTLKHASATTINVTLHRTETGVDLSVIDDGIGFDRNTVVEGIGFSSMQERAKQLGGELTINSAPGNGTSVQIVIAFQPKYEG